MPGKSFRAQDFRKFHEISGKIPDISKNIFQHFPRSPQHVLGHFTTFLKIRGHIQILLSCSQNFRTCFKNFNELSENSWTYPENSQIYPDSLNISETCHDNITIDSSLSLSGYFSDVRCRRTHCDALRTSPSPGWVASPQ